MKCFLALVFSLSMGLPVQAQPSLSEHLAAVLVQHYRQKQPALPPPTALSLTQAETIQIQFVEQLKPNLGEVVGYKAALTSPPAQQRFGVEHPLSGLLLQQMLLPTGSRIAVDFGTRSLTEGDLMVRVGSSQINQAETTQDILASLDAVIPFIELPDLVYFNPQGLNASALIAVNAGARFGVMGEAIALEPTAAWEQRLGEIRLELLNDRGEAIATGDSQALLGHPLTVVGWLRDDLKRRGIVLKPGDLLSLGSITPLLPVQPGLLRARYWGLRDDGPVEISIQFDPPGSRP